MDMKHIMTTLLALALCATATAQDFDKYFTDSTLRLDYIFEGNARQQHIALDQLLIECSVVDGHAVDVFLLTEMNGERHRIDPRLDLGNQIRGGIHNDPCFQFLQASCFPLLWAIASKLLLMAERLR